MTNYDDYITGLHDSNSPMNLREELFEEKEIEKHKRYSCLLVKQLNESTERNKFLAKNIRRLAELEQINSTFGSLTFEEQKEKREILEPYNQ